jgi:hypothetical protein
MDVPVVVIDDKLLSVEPGQVVETVVRLRNVGTQVEQYGVEVLGASRAWSDVVPRHVSLMPGDERDVRILFRPPRRPAAPVGEFPFGVRCASEVDPDRCAVAEGDIAVGAIHGLEARLVTVTGRGRHRGRYRLDVHNTGTVAATVVLAVFEAAESLSFALTPDRLDIPAGETASAYLLVRPLNPTLLGKGSSHPFWLTYEVDGPVHNEGRVDAVFARRPVLPRALIPMTAALLCLGVAAIVAVSLLARQDKPEAPSAVAAPSVPTIANVEFTPEGVQIRWKPVPRVASYSVQQLLSRKVTDIIDSTKVAAEQTALIWPKTLPDGERCFRVQAVNAGGSSEASAAKCTTVVTTQPLTTEDFVGPFAVLEAILQADVDSFRRAQDELARFQDAGLQIKLIDSSKTKALVGKPPSYVIFADDFADLADARKFCKRNSDVAPDCAAFAALP